MYNNVSLIHTTQCLIGIHIIKVFQYIVGQDTGINFHEFLKIKNEQNIADIN